nr:Na+/H+ antiporter [Paracidobacterium acidisoli]
MIFVMLAVIGLATLARRMQRPYPLILVIGGLVLSLIPGLPRVSLDPDLIFLVLLPPLIFAAAFNTSWRDFRYNLVSILLLAFGLVGFTVLCIALCAPWLLPGFDARTGAVLGAVVCTTDAIATTAIARRAGLPRQITDVLEGESLVNDASGLLALEFAVGLVVTGERPTFAVGLTRLLVLVIGGVIVGLVVGKLIQLAQRYVTDPPVEITITLITPYLAWLGAEALHTSGALATVACGLYLGRMRSVAFTTEARLESSAVWNTIDFVLNSFAFILIGLQLPRIMSGIRDISRMQLMRDAALFVVLVIAVRLIWIFPGARIAWWIRNRVLHQGTSYPSVRGTFLIGWAGMRGVLCLAAAISLPEELDNGQPFPHRNVIIFFAFAVILVTLVVQGFSLPPLIRWLGLAATEDDVHLEEREARCRMIGAALKYLDTVSGETEAKADHGRAAPLDDSILSDLKEHYQRRLAVLQSEAGDDPSPTASQLSAWRRVTGRLRSIERTTAMQLRDENRISDEVLRTLERELDLIEVRRKTP